MRGPYGGLKAKGDEENDSNADMPEQAMRLDMVQLPDNISVQIVLSFWSVLSIIFKQQIL